MIQPFPNEVKYGGNNGTTIVLTREQDKWLCLFYPTTLNKKLASMMGIDRTTLTRIAKRLGLTKSHAYYQAKNELLSEQAKRLIEKERKRDSWGLTRHTKYHLPQKPFTRKELMRRHKALEKGYVLSPDLTDDGGKRHTIFYDNETKRSPRFEANCLLAGFQIKPWK